MNFEQIKELIDHIDASSLYDFEMINEDISLKMSKRKFAENQPNNEEKPVLKKVSEPESGSDTDGLEKTGNKKKETAAEENDYHVITAPIVGTSYLSSSPDSPPFISVGDEVKKGQTLVIIEAMKVMNEIKSDRDGMVADVLVEDGQPVEFNQQLVKIK
ncbi:MAG: acetyl-CoA carboxylase biotin carboxyl carrier protein [Alkalibacterium sp.]|nr:acetyl-CoA carboxylase biotin carboxyl carrier protein [Alkalibacterium sp.]TVP92550.1 MAG: acetyl-CoA carboxylase biotin carboxyl carrier protein [Alkalibacterium sp.]